MKLVICISIDQVYQCILMSYHNLMHDKRTALGCVLSASLFKGKICVLIFLCVSVCLYLCLRRCLIVCAVVCVCCSSVPGKDKLGETLKKKPLGAKPKLSSSRPSHDSIVSQMIRAAKKL